jgi:Arc/MetJ-type ribon-helix-helix transcriptional regulator
MGLHINLTPEQERLLKDELQSGHYETVEQVIGEALRALREREGRSAAGLSSPEQREAVRGMFDFIEKNTVRLEDVSVRQLIHEGHRL